MRLLILGGTGFLGRHLVAVLQSFGHQVTLFDRGLTAPDLFPELERLRGDREADLSALEGRTWDAVFDLSGYTPQAVEASAGALAAQAAHYVFVSTISAYADLGRPEIAEGATLAREGRDYGAAKAASERVLERVWPGSLLRVRPGMLVGPHDPTGRFAYWVRRVAREGDVLTPGPPERPVQVLDARDLADWLATSVASGRAGVFNAVGPGEPLTMAELLETCRRVAGSEARPRWVEPEALLHLGVEPWTDLPLWPATAFAGFHEVDGREAVRAGLRFRQLDETVRDVLEWENANPGVSARRGLTPKREAELLRVLA